LWFQEGSRFARGRTGSSSHTNYRDTGYEYVYTKTIRLAPDKPVMTLEHSQGNTGKKVIEGAV
jgi:hypothetical protein